jgi:pyrroline-5-carboxylate reductase
MYFPVVSTSIFFKNMDFQNIQERSIGFIGCGKISSAVCRGFATLVLRPKRLYVSLRSTEKSQILQSDFPDLVEVTEDNQRIVDHSDIIFIGLLPPVAAEILPKLTFGDDKLVISMMAGVNYSTTLSFLRNVPSSQIVRTVPLPSAAQHTGPVLMYPPHPTVESILNFIGTSIVCDEEQKLLPMISVTGHISSFYELLNTTHRFLISEGISFFVSTHTRFKQRVRGRRSR